MPVTFGTGDFGIKLGASEDYGMIVNLDIMCASDAETTKEKSLTLEMGVHIPIDFDLTDFVLNVAIGAPSVTGTVTKDSVMKLDYHNWDMELTYVLVDIADNFNLHFEDPIDLKQANSKIRLLSSMIPSSRITPKAADGFFMLAMSILQ